ncbi:MAG: hypothetical protein P8103_08105 [Candidatus Thiodiazotropha sp.]
MIGSIKHNNRAWPVEVKIRELSTTACLIASLICAGNVLASDVQTLESKDVREFVDSKEQISGNSTVGVLYIGNYDKVNPDQLFAKVDVQPGDVLILKINSIDGRYSCEVRYHIDSRINGWRGFRFKSDHKEFIKQYPIGEIAVLLTDGKGELSYPLRWSKDKKTDKLRIFVNSERARTYYYHKENGKKSAKFCSKSSLASGFKFNSTCDVPVSDIPDTAEINIHRKFGIRPLDPIKIKLSLR